MKNNEARIQRGFQEAWYLKLNDPQHQRALWLRFTLLSTDNGFRRVAETWAIFFQRKKGREVQKVALKQTFDLGAFSSIQGGIQIGPSQLTGDNTQGIIQSKGQSIEWNLSFIQEKVSPFKLVSPFLNKTRLIQNSVNTLCEDLSFTGTLRVNGETFTWTNAPGMQGHIRGTRNEHSWVWGHCNTFMNEQGKPVEFIFEGFTARGKIGPLVVPRLSSFYFHYLGKSYVFNTFKDAIYTRSENTLNEWTFQADRGDLSFRGKIHAEYKDFAGLTYEDTNGSLLYCTNTKLSDMKIFVYRNSKLEATFTASGTASFEVVSRNKNPYVPLLI